MSTQIDQEEFKQHVYRLAFENPDFRYTQRGRLGTIPASDEHDGPACVYVFNGCPDCLIGQALHAAGVPVAELEELDRLDITKARGVLGRFGVGPVIAKWAGLVQDNQDRGLTWGDCVRMADEYFDPQPLFREPVPVLPNR